MIDFFKKSIAMLFLYSIILFAGACGLLEPEAEQGLEPDNFDDALYFDHKFTADHSFEFDSKNEWSTSVAISDNKRVGVIEDQIGEADLHYAGDNKAPLADSYPKYFKSPQEKEGYIFIDNVFNEYFVNANALSPAMEGRRELWIVLRRPGIAATYEIYCGGWKSGYFADRGDKLGLHVNDGNAIAVNNSQNIPLYMKTLVRIKLDGDKSEVFVNNTRVEGPLSGGYFKEGDNASWQYMVVGTSTNNAYWDWYASYYKKGNFTPEEAGKVYKELAERHDTGTLPPLPYASDLEVYKEGNVYKVKYTFNNPLGFPEDKEKTEFKLVYGGRGGAANLQDAFYVPEMDNLGTFDCRDYFEGNTNGNPELFSPVAPYAWFRMVVKVYDSEGNTWRFQSSKWMLDNYY